MRKTRKEDLMEGECACGEVSCTSAECQAMAPAKVVSPAYYSGNKKKALGKKDKYNKLGEKNLKEWRASSAAEGLGWVDSELDTIETNLSVLEDFIGAVCDPNDEIFNNISAIHSSINYIRSDCINFKESVNLKENGEVQSGSLKGTDPEFWEFLQMTFNREEDPYMGSYDDLVEAVESFKKDWINEGSGNARVLRYTANKWLSTEGRSLCSEELLQREYNDYYSVN